MSAAKPKAQELLETLGIPDRKIERVLTIQLGAIAISNSDHRWIDDQYPFEARQRAERSDRGEEAKVDTLYEQVVESLRRCKQVQDFRVIDPSAPKFAMKSLLGQLVYGPAVRLLVNLPVAQQKYHFEPFKLATPVEKCVAFVSGSLWSVTWELEDFEFSGLIAQEFREVLRGALAQQPGLFARLAGRSPLGFSIYVLVDSSEESDLHFAEHGGNLIAVVPRGLAEFREDDDRELGYGILKIHHLPLLTMFAGLVAHEYAGACRREARTRFQDMTRCALDTEEAPVWNPVRRLRLARQGNRHFVHLMSAYAEAEDAQARARQDSESMQRSLGRENFLRLPVASLVEEFREEDALPTSLVESARSLGADIQGGRRWLVTAAISTAAAVLGALVTWLVSGWRC